MISKEEVSRISKLARLELSEQEVENMQKDLSGILDYFELLNKQKTTAKKTSKNVVKNRLRKDEVVVKETSLDEKILALVPERKERYIKVKSVL